MARRGGYGKSEPVEWVKLHQMTYGEAVHTAVSMGQTLDIWMTDAVVHHIYRCQQIKGLERYQADELDAQQSNSPTPDRTAAKYQPTMPKPTITRRQPGEAAAGPRPRP